jgi:transposase InsO family protein
VEEQILQIRASHSAWGGRKIRRELENRGLDAVPAASTITRVLHRHQEIDSRESQVRTALQRFERPHPNDLWQMDFKGPLKTAMGQCHPLSVLDDCSRYALCVTACPNQREESVRPTLTETFRRYGLPLSMLMDNGACWGRPQTHYTHLGAWLIRLGISLLHGRPYHPQTQGKVERFHRTLGLEAILGQNFRDLAACQQRFDEFRHCYNQQRPHEALNLETPISRYRPSPLEFPEQLPPLEYPQAQFIRKVGPAGYFSFQKHRFQVGRAFSGHHIGLFATLQDGVFDVYFAHQNVARINIKEDSCDLC